MGNVEVKNNYAKYNAITVTSDAVITTGYGGIAARYVFQWKPAIENTEKSDTYNGIATPKNDNADQDAAKQ